MRDRMMLGASVLVFLSICWVCLVRHGGLRAAEPPASTGPLAAVTVNWTPREVSLTGTLPDAATSARVQARVESVSSGATVRNDVQTGERAAPEPWMTSTLDAIRAARLALDAGELRVDGNTLNLVAAVADETERRTVMDTVRQAAGAGHTVTDGLTVTVEAAVAKLQRDLSSRLSIAPLEFNPGGVNLVPASRDSLAALAPLLGSVPEAAIHITTAAGASGRSRNLAEGRARAVRTALIGLGLDAARVAAPGVAGASGRGGDAPTPFVRIDIEGPEERVR